MVIHDMRTPTCAIEHGIKVTLDNFREFLELFKNMKESESQELFTGVSARVVR